MKIDQLFSVAGKAGVVTGGSLGIGLMIASALVENGVRVYITARKADACDAAAERLSVLGQCTSIPADLSRPEEIARFADAVREREPALGILVNNAGATWGAPLDEFPADAFDKVLGVNLKAPFLLTQTFLPQLRAAATADDPARVVMIGSIDGVRVPTTENYPYAASKAGLHMLTRQLAHRLVGDNITVNAIMPGPFESRMMAYILDDPGSRKAIESIVPRGRIGSTEDVAGAVIYLASRAGAYLTGVGIPVDGGISTHG